MFSPIPISELVVGSKSEIVIRIIAKEQFVRHSDETSFFSVVGNDKADNFIEVKCLNSEGLHGKIREGHVLRFVGYVSLTTLPHQASIAPLRKMLVYDASSGDSHVSAAPNDGIPYLPAPLWWQGGAHEPPGLPLKVQRTFDASCATSFAAHKMEMRLGKQHNSLPSPEELEILREVTQMEEREMRVVQQQKATISGYMNDGWDPKDIEVFKEHKKKNSCPHQLRVLHVACLDGRRYCNYAHGTVHRCNHVGLS